MRHIAVLGSGLAGVRAATRLEQRLEGRRHTRLTVVANSTHFVYRPLLAHVLSGQLETTALSIPLTDLLETSTELVVDEIEGVDSDRRRIVGADREVPFDYLLIAPPPVADWRGHSEWRQNTHPFETLGDAADIRQMLASHPDSKGASDGQPQRIVVIGAGPNGIELTGQLHHVLTTGKPDRAIQPMLHLVDSSEVPLPNLPSELRNACWEYLRRRDVEFVGGAPVETVSEDGVELGDGRRIDVGSELPPSIFWCAGVRPPAYLASGDLPTNDRGRIRVDKRLAVENCTGIYAAGTAATGPVELPSHVRALREQGRLAAENLLADVSGRTPLALKFDDPARSIALGPDKAAVYRNGAVVSGRPGATLHRLMHTSLIPGAMKKVGLLRSWLRES